MFILVRFRGRDGAEHGIGLDVDPSLPLNRIIEDAAHILRHEGKHTDLVFITCHLPHQEVRGPRPIGAVIEPIVDRVHMLRDAKGSVSDER